MMKNTLLLLNHVDIRFFLLAAHFFRPSLVQCLARTLSKLADGPCYLGLALIILLVDEAQGSVFFITGLLAYAIEIPLYLFLKRCFKRARPFKQLNCWHGLNPADEFSFPSGHTAAAAVFAGLLGVFYVDALLPLVIFVALVGASRVALGVHFFGDILAGALLGVACVSGAYQLIGNV